MPAANKDQKVYVRLLDGTIYKFELPFTAPVSQLLGLLEAKLGFKPDQVTPYLMFMDHGSADTELRSTPLQPSRSLAEQGVPVGATLELVLRFGVLGT